VTEVKLPPNCSPDASRGPIPRPRRHLIDSTKHAPGTARAPGARPAISHRRVAETVDDEELAFFGEPFLDLSSKQQRREPVSEPAWWPDRTDCLTAARNLIAWCPGHFLERL